MKMNIHPSQARLVQAFLAFFLCASLMLAVPTAEAASVNINTANAEEIATALPGVGAAKAAAIVQYREENGSFKSADQLQNVPGIGEKTFEKIKASIKVD